MLISLDFLSLTFRYYMSKVMARKTLDIFSRRKESPLRSSKFVQLVSGRKWPFCKKTFSVTHSLALVVAAWYCLLLGYLLSLYLPIVVSSQLLDYPLWMLLSYYSFLPSHSWMLSQFLAAYKTCSFHLTLF